MNFFITFIITIFFSNFAFSNSLFDTNFYEISFNSNNIEDDKLKKIRNIKYKSIKTIFNNILEPSDFKDFEKKVNEDLINTFIKNIIIEDEKIINNNYSSQVKINYSKSKIITYLRSKNIGYVEFHPVNFLTIIYEKNNLEKKLFSKNNSYYNYLINNKNNLYYLPLLDINDRFIMSYDDIENLNLNKIRKFLSKYSKTEAILIISSNLKNENQYTLYFYHNNNFEQINKYNFINKSYEILFDNVESDVVNFWKSKNLIQNDTFNNINCDVPYFNLLELKYIKSKLSNISIIKQIKLNNISFSNNNYNIDYYGTKKTLPILFQMNGLDIKIFNNKCKILLK